LQNWWRVLRLCSGVSPANRAREFMNLGRCESTLPAQRLLDTDNPFISRLVSFSFFVICWNEREHRSLAQSYYSPYGDMETMLLLAPWTCTSRAFGTNSKKTRRCPNTY